MADRMIRAIDRATGKTGEYTEAFLAAWPHGYTRLPDKPATGTKAKKPSDRAASPVSTETRQKKEGES